MKSVFLSLVIPCQDFEVALNRGPILGSAGLSPWHRARLPYQFCILGCLTELFFEDKIVLLKIGFRITSLDYFEGHKDSCLWKACDGKQELSSEAF